MAQIIPPITSLPLDSGAAPSVEDIQDRLPSICVDYLSHDWTEEDVWASWRSMTRHKHEIANGLRLENASWRTWNKQRNKLRTISPETLNWLKDSDVTWLYGPLHTASVEPVRPLKISSTDDRYGIDRPTARMKPILKHRTLSELLTIPSPSSPILEAITPDDDDSGDDAMRPALLHTKSDTNIVRSRSVPTRKRSPPRLIVSGIETPTNEPSTPAQPVAGPSGGKRHISFNTFVQQCIALDEPAIPQVNRVESDDEMLEMRSSSSKSSIKSPRPSLSRHSSTSSEPLTIAKIAPAMLKTTGSYTNNPQLPKMVYQPTAEYLSPAAETAPPVPSPFDFPSPQVQTAGNRWQGISDDEEFGSVGFDYFGGPDLTGTSPQRAIPIATPSYGRAPAVQQPPAQPKWRQPAAAAAQPVEPSSVSPSSSSSSSSLNGILSPQPGRSILKVRPPGSVSSPEPVSPPSHFNYNPSVATGFGGMFGGYDATGQAIPVVSPPDERGRSMSEDRGREERGRSTSRGHGSSQYDRSTSRGTSVSSTSSIGSSSRSPTDSSVKTRVQSQPQLDKVQEGTPWEPSQPASEAMDIDYVPERSSTPTPHSSPQIVFRPLKDTSPASLPHASSRPSAPGLVPDLHPPYTDPATTVSPTHSTGQARATVAHVPVNAQPTLSQPVDDDDGSTLIGRATNIANTAKDILGALWYGGAQEDSSRGPRGGNGAAGQPVPRRHSRGASLG